MWKHNTTGVTGKHTQNNPTRFARIHVYLKINIRPAAEGAPGEGAPGEEVGGGGAEE